MNVAIHENDTTIYGPDLIETMPVFPGGEMELWGFLRKNVRYPVMTSDFDVEGRTIVQFIVEKDGNITNPVIIRSLDPLFDRETLRVIGIIPRWVPALLDGKPVRSKYTIPVIFKRE